MKKQTGIWIDGKEAIIVQLNKEPIVSVVESNIHHRKVGGGYGGANKSLPEDAHPDNRLLRRKKHQMARFFEELVDRVKQTDQLLILGPGEMKTALTTRFRQMKSPGFEIVAVLPTDRMTEGQLVAKVKEYFA